MLDSCITHQLLAQISSNNNGMIQRKSRVIFHGTESNNPTIIKRAFSQCPRLSDELLFRVSVEPRHLTLGRSDDDDPSPAAASSSWHRRFCIAILVVLN